MMAKYGYIFLSKRYSTREDDTAWMQEFGCETIVEDDYLQEKLRPHWRNMIASIKHGDTIVVSKLSNALRGIRELGVLLDLCNRYDIRIVSIHDGIDSKGELFPTTTVGNILSSIGRLSADIVSERRSTSRAMKRRKDLKTITLKAGLKIDREKTVVKMYNAGYSIEDIWTASGFKSRTSVFRVLARNGGQPNRGRHQGPIKKKSERMSAHKVEQ